VWKIVVGLDLNNIGILSIKIPEKNITSNKIGYNNAQSNNITFGHNLIEDKFQNNSITRFFDEKEIKKMISANPEIGKILKENNISYNLNMNELKDIMNGHAKDTEQNAIDIAKNLPQSLRQKVNIKDLKEGAMLHDIGKVLIPPEILNKTGALTSEEHKIMDLHSELGYQLLKTTGIDDNVLNLVRYHHSIQQKTGNTKSYIPDINLQILNLADKYSALTEKRVYKKEYSPEKALTILLADVKNGDVHPFIFKALVNSIRSKTSQSAVNS